MSIAVAAAASSCIEPRASGRRAPPRRCHSGSQLPAQSLRNGKEPFRVLWTRAGNFLLFVLLWLSRPAVAEGWLVEIPRWTASSGRLVIRSACCRLFTRRTADVPCFSEQQLKGMCVALASGFAEGREFCCFCKEHCPEFHCPETDMVLCHMEADRTEDCQHTSSCTNLYQHEVFHLLEL